MLRTMFALGLVFVAFLIMYGAIIVIFLMGPGVLDELLGGRGSVIAAFVAFGIAILITRRVMQWSDRLLSGEDDAQALLDRMAPPPTEEDHVATQAQVARNKRWAYLRRTRQFDKLAALEAEEAERAKSEAAADAEPEASEPSAERRQ